MSVGPGGDGHFTGSSAAFAGGAAALVRGYDPSLTAAQVRTRLETTAYRPSGRLTDPAVGYGTVDPLAAVSQRASAVSPPGSAPPVPVHVHAVTHSRSPVGTALGVAAGGGRARGSSAGQEAGGFPGR
jgi:membrane-anchored mycosin MYCP